MQKLPIAIAFTLGCQFACAAQKHVAISNLLSVTQCPITSEGMTLYTSNESFQTALSGGNPIDQIVEARYSASKMANTKINGGTWALAINLGAKPSLGYGIELVKHSATINNGVMRIFFQERVPESSSVQAAIMTMPCLVIGFKSQKISKIVAVSNQKIRELTINSEAVKRHAP